MFGVFCAPLNDCANHPARVVLQDPPVENPRFDSWFLGVSSSWASDVQENNAAGFPQAERAVENPRFDTNAPGVIECLRMRMLRRQPALWKTLVSAREIQDDEKPGQANIQRVQQRVSHRARTGFPQPLFRRGGTQRPLRRVTTKTETCDDDYQAATIAERKQMSLVTLSFDLMTGLR
jgi:hypothetical protein